MIWRWGIARIIFDALYMVMLKLISIFVLVRSAVVIYVSKNHVEYSIKVNFLTWITSTNMSENL
jgi:hypothetical protein